MRPSRPTAIRSKKNSCGDRHARRREAERRSRQSSLVLVDDRQPSDDALRPRRDSRRGQGALSEELGCLEGVGEAGRGALASGSEPTGASKPARLRHRPSLYGPLTPRFGGAFPWALACHHFFRCSTNPSSFAFRRTSSSSLRSILAASAYVFPKSREALRSWRSISVQGSPEVASTWVPPDRRRRRGDECSYTHLAPGDGSELGR